MLYPVDSMQLQLPSGNYIVFDFNNDDPTTPYIFKGVTGLEAVPSEISLITARGARTFRSREIVIRFALNPTRADANHQNLQLRDAILRLYGATAIMTTLILRTGALNLAWVMVALKDLDVDLNAPDPEYVLTLETGELSPNFKQYAPGPYTSSLGTTYGSVNVDNPGQVPNGFIFQAVLSAIPTTPTAISISISYISPPGFPLDTGAGIVSIVGAPAFAVGDVIIYDTYSNSLSRLRGGIYFNLLSYLAPGQDKVFYQLVPGNNTVVSLTTKCSSVQISYTPEWVGV